MVLVEVESVLSSVGEALSLQVFTSAAGTFQIDMIQPSVEASNEDLKEFLDKILHPKKDSGDMWGD